MVEPSLPLGSALPAQFGQPRAVRALPSSPRSRVWLVEFDDGPAVVKQAVGAGAAERFAREVTALRLAARVRPAVAPELLGTSDDNLVLVVEYLTARGGPVPDWHILYAQALARLHGATGPADADALPRLVSVTETDEAAFTRLARRWDVDVSDPVRDELAALADRLSRTDRYQLLHGDPCPDNAIVTADGLRLVDLDGAGLGAGSTELAYLHSGFPTCWCVTAATGPALAEAEAAYRAIAGEVPAGDVADACAGWLMRGDGLVERARRGGPDQFERLTRRDWQWGTASARDRFIHRLRVVAAFGRDRPELAHIGRLCQTLAERARYRWPGVSPLPTAEGNPLEAPVTRQ